MALRDIAFENAKYTVFVGKSINEGYKPEDQICVEGLYYTFNDVFTCALQSGRCPLESLQNAEKFGHKIYWLGQNPIVVSAQKTEQKECAFSVSLGDKVKYAGKIFTVESAPNDNLVLIEQ